jgi:DNA-binding protein H-NS
VIFMTQGAKAVVFPILEMRAHPRAGPALDPYGDPGSVQKRRIGDGPQYVAFGALPQYKGADPSFLGACMSNEFSDLSDLELLSLITRGEQELERRKNASKDKLKEEIEEKLKNAGLELGELFPETAATRRSKSTANGEGKPVKAKYRDPVSLETWSGRGARPPYWVKRILAERSWTLEEFKRSGEYEI